MEGDGGEFAGEHFSIIEYINEISEFEYHFPDCDYSFKN